MKIRSLTVKDRKKLSELMIKLTNTTGDSSLLNIFSAAQANAENSGVNTEQDSTILLGINIFKSLLSVLEEETHLWFSDLVGVTPEELLNMPIDTELRIIDQICNSTEGSSFFALASELYNKIMKFRTRLKSEKTK